YLVVPFRTSRIDGEEGAAIGCRSAYRPVDCQCHVAHIDERPPGSTVAQDGNVSGSERAGDEVVEHKVETQPGTHATCSCKTQAGNDKVFVRKRLKVAFRENLGTRIGR